jgi:hypothetical protein
MTTQMRPLLERRSVQLAIVVLAAAAVYATSLKVPFLAWDDTYYVTLSGRTQHPGLAGFLSLWSSDDTTGTVANDLRAADSVRAAVKYTSREWVRGGGPAIAPRTPMPEC